MIPPMEPVRGASPSGSGAFRSVVRTPAYVQVAEQLRDAILAGRLAAGDELPTERELTEQFGVSRTTLREALRALQAQGLVTSRAAPRRPIVNALPNPLSDAIAVIKQRDQVSLFDLIQFRGMLELEAIDRGSLEHGPDHWSETRSALARMREAVGDPVAFQRGYVEFHLALVRAAGNEMLHLSAEATFDALDEHLLEAFHRVARSGVGAAPFERAVDDHAAILAALEAGDAAKARDVILEMFTLFYNELFVAPTSRTSDVANRG
jgi:DNA-binding FadR family transcriptional regulator